MAGQNNSERNGRKVHMPIAKAGRSKIHGNSVHNRESQKNKKCDLCGKSFSRPEHLNIHINSVHCSKKEWSCDDFCRKEVAILRNLNTHINRGLGTIFTQGGPD